VLMLAWGRGRWAVIDLEIVIFLTASQPLTLLTRQGRVSQKAMTDEQAREVRLHKINIVHEFGGVLNM